MLLFQILSQCIAAILFKNILMCSIGALSMFTTAVSFFKLLFCSCNWSLNYIYQFKTFALKRRKFLKFICKWHSVICAKKKLHAVSISLHPVSIFVPGHFDYSKARTKPISWEHLLISHSNISKATCFSLWNPGNWRNQFESRSRMSAF